VAGFRGEPFPHFCGHRNGLDEVLKKLKEKMGATRVRRTDVTIGG
jgi:hypothetical protein